MCFRFIEDSHRQEACCYQEEGRSSQEAEHEETRSHQEDCFEESYGEEGQTYQEADRSQEEAVKGEVNARLRGAVYVSMSGWEGINAGRAWGYHSSCLQTIDPTSLLHPYCGLCI
jgi:hypothetical protein